MIWNIWWSFLRFLSLLDDLTVYFSIQLGRCALLSFPVLAAVLILRRGILRKKIFLKGMVWGIFLAVPFLGKLNLFYDSRWMCRLFMWWNDLCMVCRPARYGYVLCMAVSAAVIIRKRSNLHRMLHHMEKRYICGQEVFVCEMAATPFAAGVFHPGIAVPAVMIEQFGTEELEMILFHEKTHIRLGHLWYYLLWDVIRVLLWPNFLLSVCMREFREDLEDICDQATMQEGGMDAYEYGKLLIGSIKILQEETPGGTAAFAGEKEYREVRQRILRITEYAPYEKRRVRILCVCALAVLAGIFLMIYGNSFPRYVKLMDMVVTNDAEEYWVLKDSGMLRKAVSADEEKVYIDRAAMDVVLREYGIEDSQFTLLFGGYEKLPGFGGNGNLVYVDYSGQEERLEIPYEDSDVYITARILKMV